MDATKSSSQPHEKGKSTKATHVVQVGHQSSPSLEDSEEIFLVHLLLLRVAPIQITVTAGGHKLDMELDADAAVSLISEDTFKSTFKDSVKLKSHLILLFVHIHDCAGYC